MPDASYELLSEELSEGRFLTCADLDLALRLSLHEKQAFLADYADVSGELANRIRHLLPEYTGFDQFCALLKTKQIAYTRVRRALLHILLGLGSLTQEYSDSGEARSHCFPTSRGRPPSRLSPGFLRKTPSRN